MTSLSSLFTLYPFDIFLKPKYGFGSYFSLFNGANQNFYIPKVSGTIPANIGVFQITGQNSTENYSWGGTFNTSSRDKTASITMKLVYKVK
jgi:hypothetical protein